MRRSKAEVERYIASVQSSAPTQREKSMKGFFFAKLYYEAKEYELAKRYISSYLEVQERDPKALKFLGHLYEVEGHVDKAVGCYKSSVELNPTQKDLVLKIAELLCDKNVDDGRADYWVERASKLFPGSPAVYKLKEKLLNFKGDVGWNQLFDLIQSELYTRPDDVYVNIRLVELYRANKRLEEAVTHCLNAEKKGILRSSLEWCSCVVHILKEYLKSFQGMGPDKSLWRSLNKELLLAHCNLMLLTLSTKDVQECRRVFQSFDQTLQSVKPYVGCTDDLSITFVEIRGHFYMYAGTLLLKLAQQSEAQWRAVTEPAALCYLIAFQVPKPKMKSIKVSENGQDLLELLACDRRSQTGHMLRNLTHSKKDFLKGVVETFANKSGHIVLFDVLFEKKIPMEQSFLGCDDIRNVESKEPELAELARCDNGSIRLHNGNLHHLAWLGLQWHKSSPPAIRKWLKQLFPRLPQESARLDTNAPESICLLDLEIFLLGVIFSSSLQLQDHFNIHYNAHQPKCLPLAVCTQLDTERQKSWWDAVYNLINKKTQPGASAKLRLLFQHELITLRALEKHGLQPAMIIHWARNLHKTGSAVNSYYDQKDYMVRCVHYWKKVLPLLEGIRNKRSIPEPIDPLFKHFHSQDIQGHEVAKFEEEARIAFASLDVVDGKFDEAIQTFKEIKNVVSYWNLARIFQRKAEDIENDAISPDEQEECANCLQKSKMYLSKIIDESFADSTVAETLPVSLETVKKMLDSVLQELGEYVGEEPSAINNEFSQIDTEIENTPSPTKYCSSPNKSYKLSPKTPPRWVEDQKALLQMLCHQVEVLKNEVRELKLNSSSNASQHRWTSEGLGHEAVPDGYQGAHSFHGTPLTVSTAGSSGYYNQPAAYNSKYLLKTAANDTSVKAPVHGMNRLAPQQHMYGYQPQVLTPPLHNTSKFHRETYVTPTHFESPAPGHLSPDYYNYSITKNTSNPPLPEPGYFTKPTTAPQRLESKTQEFGKVPFGHTAQSDSFKVAPFINPSQSTSSAFKFTSNFLANDGDFTFSTPQFVAPSTNFTGSESLFSLLTSGKPFQDSHSGQKITAPSQVAEQRNTFNFGTISSGISLTENTTQSPSVYDKEYPTISFQDPRTTVVERSNADVSNVSHQSDGVSVLEAAEDEGPHFEPVVPLPDKIEVKTGEEEEEELFSNRAKLFRFDTELMEWKERGIGIVKILRHSKSGKVRLLMRREQVLKICANHYINPEMTLKPNAGSDKSYVWYAVDYADETPKPEQLALRFKMPEEAQLFKKKFEAAQKLLTESTSVGSQAQQCAEPSQVKKKDQTAARSSSASDNFGHQFTRKLGEWDCDACLVRNVNTALVCVACQTPPKGSNKVKATPAVNANLRSSVACAVPKLPTFSFGKELATASPADGFSSSLKKLGEWDCDVCSMRNAASALVCVTCHTVCPNGSAQIVAPVAVPSISVATSASVHPPPSFSFSKESANSVPSVSGSSGHSRKKKGPWVCRGCSATNEAAAKICGMCKTPITTISAVVSNQLASSDEIGSSDVSASVKSGFGAQFSRKEGQWDCNVCLVRNEASSPSCAACFKPNPQAAPASKVTFQPSSGFKFGTSTGASSLKPIDFGTQFLKKGGQWDCTVCLVRNEPSLENCASCQTPNPGVKAVSSFAPASSAFNFGLKSKLAERAVGKSGAEGNIAFSESPLPFGDSLLKKAGQWDCANCLVINDLAAKVCTGCQTPSKTCGPIYDTKSCMNKPSFELSSSVKSNFGDSFTRKEGQWDCNVCLVRNEATSASCVSCLTPNPEVTPASSLTLKPASGFKFGSSTETSTSKPSSFGSLFSKKEGQWDCNVCLVRNEATSSSCVSCLTPNPEATPASSLTLKPASGFKFGSSTETSTSKPSSFGSLFSKKEGQWDCNVCLVRNEATSSSCVSCLTPNPEAPNASSATLNPASGFKFGSSTETSTSKPSSFGSLFSKKEGQWDCNVSLVRNEATSSSCVSCLTPNPEAPNASSATLNPAFGFKFGSSTETSTSKPSSFGSLFSKKEGQWDCNVCLVRNEATSSSCVSCLTPNPEAPNASSATLNSAFGFKFGSSTETSSLKQSGFGSQVFKKEGHWCCSVCLVKNASSLTYCAACQHPSSPSKTGPAPSPASLAFTFGLKSKVSEPICEQSDPELKNVFSESSFKFGQCEQDKTAPALKMPSFSSETESITLSVPGSSGGFKFGIQEPPKSVQQSEQSKSLFKRFSGIEQKEKPLDSISVAFKQSDLLPCHNNVSFSFTDLASDGPFAKKDIYFKSISQADEKLNSLAEEGTKVLAEPERDDELYQTEERDDIHFEPLVELPEKVEVLTGEEEEKVFYSERVKLFRFDADTSQWKERGVGNLKILQNERTGALRMLMRRDQVFKVCANHWITKTINLKPLSGSDRAWMWLANDFSDGDAKLEQLAAKFKTSDQAQDFKYRFELSQRLLLNIPPQTNCTDSNNERSKESIGSDLFIAQSKPHKPDQKNAPSEIHTSDIAAKLTSCHSLDSEKCDLQKNFPEDNIGNTTPDLSAVTIPVKRTQFSFGESAAGFNFSFQPVVSPVKSPNKLDNSRLSVGTDESDVTQEEEREGPYFEPVVPLPDLVDIASGEENEQMLFGNRAKLYRFDKDANQWKERGIGDIKILQNYDTKSVRIIMRRDQVLKICANHRISSEMSLKPMLGTEKAWVWTAHDFAEGEGKTELLAVRFKLQDVADSFHDIFYEAKQAQECSTLLTPLPSRGSTPKGTQCGKLAVAVLEETTRERTSLVQEDITPVPSPVKSKDSDYSETPTKAFVSPPKFMFGSDSVKNIFSSEKPKSFTFGSTSTSGSLFGFSFNSLKNGCEVNNSGTQKTSVKRLDFGAGADSNKGAVISPLPKNDLSSTQKGSSETQSLQVVVKEHRTEVETQPPLGDVIFVYEQSAKPEQKTLAASLKLPPTFFCYKNSPDYKSDDDQDDEDFETAVKKLNGRLYPDDHIGSASSNCHKKATNRPEGVSKDLKSESPEAIPTTLRCVPDDHCSQRLIDKVPVKNEFQDTEVSTLADSSTPNKCDGVKTTTALKQEPDSTTEDLSMKKENPDSTFKGLENFDLYGFSSSTGQSFADLASSNSGDFAFGNTEKSFTWQNYGAVVFSSLADSKSGEKAGESGDEETQNEDVHFEPIVSLSEVEVKSGEEDEEVVLKERTKMYRWDRDVGQWKERGEGEIKILFHPEKKYYRILMRRDQILKVCANHMLCKSMDIQPLTSSNNSLVWTAMDYSDGEGRIEQLAVRFKTQDLADSFKKMFEECQKKLPENTAAS
ncbi:E3 SUMO-protein ligase RanBP2-like [Ambystoma mexicanum]|uniref:E3 SUMO-protein ligase RanBP2-like n=1 Tax=Ambystoma mexicanum TaxID=8296 RepID=UPI0037E987F5